MEPWQRIDAASEAEARTLLTTCCGSSRWVDAMIARRPFGSQPALLDAARDAWLEAGERDWREAFAHPPRIGDRADLERRFPSTAQLSSREQQGWSHAASDVPSALADANRRYEERFGYIFIVCATGKTAEEMLALLQSR